MHYLIDGYNLLFALFPSKRDLKTRREEFLEEVDALFSRLRIKASIVFDGHTLGPGYGGREHFRAFTAIYTSNQSADNYIIEKLFYKPKQNAFYCIVTNDGYLIQQAKSFGAQTLKLEEFIHFLHKQLRKTSWKDPLAKPAEKKFTSYEYERWLSLFEREDPS